MLQGAKEEQAAVDADDGLLGTGFGMGGVGTDEDLGDSAAFDSPAFRGLRFLGDDATQT